MSELERRSFLKLTAAGLPGAIQWPGIALAATSTGDSPANEVTDFSRSWLHCSPNKSGIRVRIGMECLCRLVDKQSGKADEFALAVVAKTGLTKDPKSPGGIS